MPSFIGVDILNKYIKHSIIKKKENMPHALFGWMFEGRQTLQG